MFYSSHIDTAFSSVERIMRDFYVRRGFWPEAQAKVDSEAKVKIAEANVRIAEVNLKKAKLEKGNRRWFGF